MDLVSNDTIIDPDEVVTEVLSVSDIFVFQIGGREGNPFNWLIWGGCCLDVQVSKLSEIVPVIFSHFSDFCNPSARERTIR